MRAARRVKRRAVEKGVPFLVHPLQSYAWRFPAIPRLLREGLVFNEVFLCNFAGQELRPIAHLHNCPSLKVFFASRCSACVCANSVAGCRMARQLRISGHSFPVDFRNSLAKTIAAAVQDSEALEFPQLPSQQRE